MKLGVVLALGVVSTVRFTSAQVTGGGQPSATGTSASRFADEDIFHVGVAQVRAIAHGDENVGENLIKRLEAFGQTTGEIPCPPRPSRAERKWGTHPTVTNSGSNWHQIKSEARG